MIRLDLEPELIKRETAEHKSCVFAVSLRKQHLETACQAMPGAISMALFLTCPLGYLS